MKIKISKENRKMGYVPSVSLPPGATCRPGVPCVPQCYANKAWRLYPSVRAAWQSNLDLYLDSPVGYFTQLSAWLQKHKPKYFRFHVAGDIPDTLYLTGMRRACLDIPETKFLCFTKRFQFDFKHLPSNLQVVLSMWPGMDLPGPELAHMSRAWCRDGTETRVPETAIECPGGCDGCGACWGLSQKGLDVVFDLH